MELTVVLLVLVLVNNDVIYLELERRPNPLVRFWMKFFRMWSHGGTEEEECY